MLPANKLAYHTEQNSDKHDTGRKMGRKKDLAGASNDKQALLWWCLATTAARTRRTKKPKRHMSIDQMEVNKLGK